LGLASDPGAARAFRERSPGERSGREHPIRSGRGPPGDPMKRPRIVRILIVSDDRLLRDCLAERLDREEGLRSMPGCAGTELPLRLKTSRPDVLPVDQDSVGASPESLPG